MVKRTPNLRVWEQKKPKIRKVRCKKQKIESEIVLMQSDVLNVQNNNEQSASKNSQQNNNSQFIKEVSLSDPQQNIQQLFSSTSQSIDKKKRQQLILRVKQVMKTNNHLSLSHFQALITEHRPAEYKQILSFLQHKSCLDSVNHIYGSTGIGKTYLLQTMIEQLRFRYQIQWLNGYEMIRVIRKQITREIESKGLEQQMDKIIIIDQFDQLQLVVKNQELYDILEEYLAKIIKPRNCNIKLILVCNTIHSNLDTACIDMIKRFANCSTIDELPFMPYNAQQIFNIIQNRIAVVEKQFSHNLISRSSIQFATKKIYLQYQDIRPVINFLIESYQHHVLQHNYPPPKLQTHHIIKFYSQFQLKQNPIISYYQAIDKNQRAIFRQILLLYRQGNKQPVSHKKLAKALRSIQSSYHYLDLWIKQWVQLSLIKLKEKEKDKEKYFGNHLNIIPLLDDHEINYCLNHYYTQRII